MEAIVGLVHFFVALCLCGSLLGQCISCWGLFLPLWIRMNENGLNGVNQVHGSMLGMGMIQGEWGQGFWFSSTVVCGMCWSDGGWCYGMVVLGHGWVLFLSLCNIVNCFRARSNSVLYIYIIYVTYICYICNIYVTYICYICNIYNIYMLHI